MFTHRIQMVFINNGNYLHNQLGSNTAGQENNINEVIPDNSDNFVVNFAAVRAKLKSFYMVADKPITVHTNSKTAPDNIFSLQAGSPIYWYGAEPIGNFLAADITDLRCFNTTGEDALLQIRALIDPS